MPLPGTRSQPNVNDGLWVMNKVFCFFQKRERVCVCVLMVWNSLIRVCLFIMIVILKEHRILKYLGR